MDAVIFKALGNVTRLKIIEMLMIKEHNVSDLTKISGKDQTTVSRHLANLKEANIISQKRIGRNKIYAIKGSIMKAWLNMAVRNNNKPEENTPLRDKIKDFLTSQKK
ncbi:MAG: ArsR/SmtB family transcription factor [Candidatus Poseidoniales archaeon]|tara:strand:+ start:1544 stop:1864 length:321 start_codon:yes stop_codon:yes gene_type:complete